MITLRGMTLKYESAFLSNDHRFPKERSFLKDSQGPLLRFSGKSNMQMKISTEQYKYINIFYIYRFILLLKLKGDVSPENYKYGALVEHRRDRNAQSKTCPTAPLSTIDLTWTDLEPNPGHRKNRHRRLGA
jgi:hypothetical protein